MNEAVKIINGRVITPGGIVKGEVVLKDGIIMGVGEIGAAAQGARVIDAEGKIHWSYVSPIGINPGADGILAALESLPKGGTK